MKQITLIFLVLFSSVFKLNAQEEETVTDNTPRFGLKAGYTSFIARAKVDDFSNSEDVGGFYIGAFTEITLSEKFLLQPELHFANYSEDGESSSVLILPILAKFKANDEFSLYAGPQLDYLLNEDDAQFLKRLGIGIAIGASFDITEQLILDARYAFGLNNRIKNEDDFSNIDPVIGDFDVSVTINYFQIGLGYRF